MCILFGDGAGAVVLERSENDQGPGLLGFSMHSDGKGQEDLCLPYNGNTVALGDGSHQVTKGSYSPIAMNGREVSVGGVCACVSSVW